MFFNLLKFFIVILLMHAYVFQLSRSPTLSGGGYLVLNMYVASCNNISQIVYKSPNPSLQKHIQTNNNNRKHKHKYFPANPPSRNFYMEAPAKLELYQKEKT